MCMRRTAVECEHPCPHPSPVHPVRGHQKERHQEAIAPQVHPTLSYMSQRERHRRERERRQRPREGRSRIETVEMKARRGNGEKAFQPCIRLVNPRAMHLPYLIEGLPYLCEA
jgi:hypothetical protein